MNPTHIYHLIFKDILLEWRQKYAFNGIILYVFSTLFIISISFKKVQPDTWITLFWIVILFASVNAGAKSFIQDGKSKLLYYYVLASPESILLSKFVYNCLLLILLGFITLAGFVLLFGNVVENMGFFSLIVLLGSIGFAATFTMISAIASKAKGSATLMTILSFPVILPQLLLLNKLSRFAVQGFELLTVGNKELFSLMAINLIVVIISYLLFPYLWRE
ncbi:MAG: heme exporter protein CcmB [Bacteroidia bacterium]